MSPAEHCDLSLFSTRRICSPEQRKKQHDWLATNTDDIRFLLLRAKKNRKVENGLKASFPLIAKPNSQARCENFYPIRIFESTRCELLRVGFCELAFAMSGKKA